MTPAIDLVKKMRINHAVHSYSHDPRTASYGLEAAEQLGLVAGRVYKTLLVSTENAELLVALVAVNAQLNLKALATAAKVKKVEMADPQRAQRSSGYLVGGISPLAQKKALRTFVDRSAAEHATIYVSAGRRGLEVELSADDLLALTYGQFAEIASLGH
ncbi:Cys-tRNA(Pro) deacylase [Denitrificimonas caeni]|uniref:Cys-tRNA(Pro) deacylase n=1 Tax=Denitrificimonas caeni TaxID=521720 RepID=UPI0003B52B98|nr:Cys-tRNA(Pro) deacylase [Denitrificimonas caeni]